jgi:hypothetical protein
MLTSGDQIFTDSLAAEEILEETVDPPLGQPGNNVKLTMRVAFTASYAAEDDLTELASTVLNASRPDGYIATGEPLSFEALNEQHTDSEGVTHWVMRVSRQLEKQLDTERITPLVQGHSLAIATARLHENLDLPNPPEIQLTPNWWPWLPLIPFNITVEIK